MINKKNLWFLTLFSLILVLSVYYITMPSELLLTGNIKQEKETSDVKASADIKESDVISALKVEADEERQEEIEALKLVLNDSKSSVDEKNNAFEKMKELNIIKGKEEDISKVLEEQYQIKTFVKIENDQVKVVVDSTEHDTKLANNIMRSVQEKFDKKMYITVQFKSK